MAYPKNFRGVKVEDQLQVYLQEREVHLQLWNALRPFPCNDKKSFKRCDYNKAFGFLASFIVEEATKEDCEEMHRNYLARIEDERDD